MNSVILEALIRPHSRLDMYILFLIASNLKFAIKWAGNQAIQFVFWIQFWNLNCGVMYLFWVIAKSSNCFWKPPNGHLATLIISSVRFYLSRKVFGVCVFRGGGGSMIHSTPSYFSHELTVVYFFVTYFYIIMHT